MSRPRQDITKQITITSEREGSPAKTTIYPLAEEILADYRLLGRGSASAPGVAIFMALRHVPDFLNRVAGYRLVHGREAEVMEEAIGEPCGSIEFYERLPFTGGSPEDGE